MKKIYIFTSIIAVILSTVLTNHVNLVKVMAADAYTPVSWPTDTAWLPYLYSDGTAVLDPAGEENPTPSDMTSGLTSGVGNLPTIYISIDSSNENIFFRYRVKGDPYDRKGGYTSTAWLVQLWDPTTQTQIGTVGIDGKDSFNDYVYVANGDGSQFAKIYETNDDASSDTVRGVRITRAENNQFFIDYQVPIAALNTVNIGRDITATTPLALFYGTSQAANLSVINKEWLDDSDGNPADITDFFVLTGGFADVNPTSTSSFNTSQTNLNEPDVIPNISISGFCVTGSCPTYTNDPFTLDTTTDPDSVQVTVQGTVSDYSGTVTLNILGTDYTTTAIDGQWSLDLSNIISQSGTYIVKASIPYNTTTISDTDTFSVNGVGDSLVIDGGYYVVTSNSTYSPTGSYNLSNQGNEVEYQVNINGTWISLNKYSSTSTWDMSGSIDLVPGENRLDVRIIKGSDILATATQIISYIPSGSDTSTLDLGVNISSINGTNPSPGLSGTSTGSTQVEIQLDGVTIAFVTPDANGNWEMPALDYPLNTGTYTFRAIVRNSDGEIAIDTITHTVTEVAINIDNGATYTTNDTQPMISGNANVTDGTQITVTLNGTTYTTTVINGRWNIMPSSPLSGGTYTVVASVGGKTATQELTIVTSTPELSLNGEANVDIVVGSSYTDLSATATDILDDEIQSRLSTINPVNTSIIGVYTVRYNVTNIYGNYAPEVTRTVTVRPASLSLTGSTGNSGSTGPATVSGGTAGATVYLYDSEGSQVASGVLDESGKYTFTGINLGSGYTAKQVVNSIFSIESNTAIISGENNIPVIEEVSDDTIQAINASTWTAPSTTASDVEDGNLTSNIVITYSSDDTGSNVSDEESARQHLATPGNTVKVTYGGVVDSATNQAANVYATFTSVSTPVTSVTINGTLKIEETLTTTLGPSGSTVTYQWYCGDTDLGTYKPILGATSSTYTLTADDNNCLIKVVVVGTGVYSGSVNDASETSVVKKDAPATPIPPTVTDIKYNEITVDVVPGQEYSIDGGETWQSGGTFIDLNQTTQYSIITRIKETNDTKPSLSSTATNATTLAMYTVDFIGFDGITNEKEESLSSGDDATAPSLSNSTTKRFVSWNIDFTNITSNTSVYAQYEEITGDSGLNIQASTFLTKVPAYSTDALNTRSARLTIVETAYASLTSQEQALVTSYIETNINEDTVHEYYLDASLFETVNSIESQVNESSEAFSITVSIPSTYLSLDLHFFRMHNYGTDAEPDYRSEELAYIMDTNAGTITFSTSKFSSYVLVLGESLTSEITSTTTAVSTVSLLPDTGLSQNIAAIIAFILGILGLAFVKLQNNE